MDSLQSNIKTRSASFRTRAKQYDVLVRKYYAILNENTRGGNASTVKKHTERGKFTARKRIDLLTDTGSPFLEL